MRQSLIWKGIQRNYGLTCGMYSLTQVSTIIAKSTLFIGNNSGLAPITFLSGTPSVVVLGCVPGKIRTLLNTELLNIIFCFGNGEKCTYFSCCDGFNKPNYRDLERYVCLSSVRDGPSI